MGGKQIVSPGAIEQLNNNLTTLSNQIANYVVKLISSSLLPNAVETLAYPTGFNSGNTRIVFSGLQIGNQVYYGGASWVEYTDTDGIHVKNAGGASGKVEVGIIKI